jgi:ABC-type sugar transport system ATPase subunit
MNQKSKEKMLLEVKNINKNFPGVKALDDVSLSVQRGEVHGLVGKNGAGKSTLIKIISGLYTPEEGEIIFDGRKYQKLTPGDARALGIQLVPQEQQFQPYLSVAENLFIGSWPTNSIGSVNFKEMKKKAKEALAQLGINIPIERMAGDLPLVQRQIIAIARAIFMDSKLIILDEPTPSLTATETEILFRFVRELAKKGITFIYISHYLSEVFSVCDSVTVLRNGKIVHSGQISDINGSQLVEFMIGKVIDKALQRESRKGDVVLQVENLCSYDRFTHIAFSLHKGEILGLTGLLGCGAFDFAKSLIGLYPLEKGQILKDGKVIKILNPKDAYNHKIAFLPDDRRSIGLVIQLPVDSNINLSTLAKTTNRFGFIREGAFRDVAKKYVHLLRIDTPTIIQEVRYLSGGNQQKVVVSRLLNTSPDVLVMLDPTAGIDVEAKAEIHRLMDDLTKAGMAILLLSTDMDELLALSDRVLVMHQGRIVKEFSHKEAYIKKILEASEGVLEVSR